MGEDELLTLARGIATKQLTEMRDRGAPVGTFSDMAHRALERIARERKRRLSSETLRRYSSAIVDHLRRV